MPLAVGTGDGEGIDFFGLGGHQARTHRIKMESNPATFHSLLPKARATAYDGFAVGLFEC